MAKHAQIERDKAALINFCKKRLLKDNVKKVGKDKVMDLKLKVLLDYYTFKYGTNPEVDYINRQFDIKPETITDGYIYFIEDKKSKFIKISYSLNPYNRLQELRESSGRRYEIKTLIPGSLENQNNLYKRYESVRKAGSWFRNDGLLKTFLDKKKDEATPADNREISTFSNVIYVEGICPDCPGPMEYRAVDRRGKELFRNKIDGVGTINISEYIAAVHGIMYIRENKLHDPLIVISSTVAKSWLKKGKPNSNYEHPALKKAAKYMMKEKRNLIRKGIKQVPVRLVTRMENLAKFPREAIWK